ncbi:MAG: helix-turn-helix domain-containing protein, partial [Clostridia bacterium]|nr:helix-turn-helix domain-containing protein [Clostridia bacterium]
VVKPFESHRHHEIEVSFCLEGSYKIACEGKEYTLTEGDFAVIPSMAAHSIPQQEPTASRALTLELGYALLGEYFNLFFEQGSDCIVVRKSEFQQHWTFCELVNCLKQTALLKENDGTDFAELHIKSSLYKISALLFQLFQERNIINIPTKRTDDVKKIDIALEAIYNRYNEPLDIESISASCGYSKTNLCKIFKNVTGDTFHNALNSRRVEIACILLRESDDTIEEIARKTGFLDSKSFCRVFKGIMNQTAGQYRKMNKL